MAKKHKFGGSVCQSMRERNVGHDNSVIVGMAICLISIYMIRLALRSTCPITLLFFHIIQSSHIVGQGGSENEMQYLISIWGSKYM